MACGKRIVANYHFQFSAQCLPKNFVNNATAGLRDLLLKSIPNESKAKKAWRSDGFLMPDGGGKFGAGRVTLSPAYFMQGHEVTYRLKALNIVELILFIQTLKDPLVVAASYSSKDAQHWLDAMSTTECFWNAITAIVAPKLFEAGSDGILQAYGKTRSPPKPVPVSQWPSIYSALEVIANRVTPSHQDSGGALFHYDLLISFGIGHDAIFLVEDLRADFDYFPGTMCYLCGKVLPSLYSVGQKKVKYAFLGFEALSRPLEKRREICDYSFHEG